MSFGEEFSGNRHSSWNVLCDEEEWGTLERNCPTETICPTGVVTDYLELLDAPITAKDISWPKVLCLFDLLDQESAEPELETVAAKPLASLEDFLELPSINGDIRQVLEELTVKLAKLHTDCKKELTGMEDRITAALFAKFSSPDVELVKPLAGLCLPACPSLHPPLDPHQLSFAERRQMFSTVVATTLETEEQHCNSNIGISAYRCEGDNTDIGFIDIDDTAGFTYGMDVTIASETCLLVNPNASGCQKGQNANAQRTLKEPDCKVLLQVL